MDVCYASCFCSFLCSVFIPLVTVVCAGSSSLPMVTMAPSMMGLPATSGQHAVVLPPLLKPRHSGGVVCLATVPQQQPFISDASLGLCQLCHGSSMGSFLFQSWASHCFVFLYVWCLFWCMLFAFRYHAGCCCHSTIGVCTIAILWSLPVAGTCATWWWSLAHTRYA